MSDRRLPAGGHQGLARLAGSVTYLKHSGLRKAAPALKLRPHLPSPVEGGHGLTAPSSPRGGAAGEGRFHISSKNRRFPWGPERNSG